jgi:hypothetical protein
MAEVMGEASELHEIAVGSGRVRRVKSLDTLSDTPTDLSYLDRVRQACMERAKLQTRYDLAFT